MRWPFLIETGIDFFGHGTRVYPCYIIVETGDICVRFPALRALALFVRTVVNDFVASKVMRWKRGRGTGMEGCFSSFPRPIF